MATIYIDEGDLDLVLKHLSIALDNHYYLNAVRINLAEIYLKQKAFAKAIAIIEKAIEIDPYDKELEKIKKFV